MIHSAIVIAKQPQPGRVKTRLLPTYTAGEAARIAAAALHDTMDMVARMPVAERVLAFDGDAAGWVRPGWRAVPQPVGSLDHRLAHAFGQVRPRPAVLVGMDTPQVSAPELAAFDPERFDACLGLTGDGGYWAIGFTDPADAPAAILGVPMSAADTGARQRDRMDALGLRVQMLTEHDDVDTADTALRVARLAPRTRFARTVRAIDESRVA